MPGLSNHNLLIAAELEVGRMQVWRWRERHVAVDCKPRFFHDDLHAMLHARFRISAAQIPYFY